jgi:hypothetical protein
MNQVLEISQKKYYPSSAIASDFGYSVDYVSKLVREGKVAGERVGRQWYVDRQAFAQYVDEAEFQKEQRKEELSAERKRERVVATVERHQAAVQIPSPVFAFGQATAVMACVACMTMLSYAVYTTELTTDDLQSGLSAVGTDLVLALTPAERVSPDSQVALLGWLRAWLFGEDTLVMSESATPAVVPAVTPTSQANGLVLLDGAADEAAIEAVRAQFSDPVEVRFEGEDTGLITPIFKERTGEAYRFVIVPVNQ